MFFFVCAKPVTRTVRLYCNFKYFYSTTVSRDLEESLYFVYIVFNIYAYYVWTKYRKTY